jgi:biotin synthase
MKLDERFENIMNNVSNGKGPDKEECKYLLGFEPHSLESTHMMSIANHYWRTRLQNCGVIYGQIAIDIGPCDANCQFCSFAKSYTDIKPNRMSMEEIEHAVKELSRWDDIFGIFLMTIRDVDMDYLLDAVKTARASLPDHIQVWVNIGDISYDEAVSLKEAGVIGAYHVLRLREGEDTAIDPSDRLKTFEAINKAGIQLFTCVEPIGPEHTADEIFDSVFLKYEYGLVNHAAMRRTFMPSMPIAKRGIISQLRLAQITAIICLSAVSYPDMMAVACHEPHALGLSAGGSIVSAEWGACPRNDINEETASKALSINACRRMLFEAGFSSIINGAGEQIPLNEDYLVKVGAY